MLSSDGSAWFQSRLRDYLANFNIDTIRLIDRLFPASPGTAAQRLPPEIVAVFAANLLVGCLGWWLEGDMKHSPSQIAAWIRRFIMTGFIGSRPDL
jgi:hypothetical protein